jgi:anti-anti-sigma factor
MSARGALAVAAACGEPSALRRAHEARRSVCLVAVGTASRGVLRVSLHGELDRHAASRVQPALDQLAARASALILDLRELTFIDPCGVAAILRCASGEACSLTLREPRGQVRDTLLRLGLLDRLTVVEADPA